MVYDLDGDICAPQTYFTPRAVVSLAQLLWLFEDPDPGRPVYRAQLAKRISRDEVRALLDEGIAGLLSTNRVGAGWVDIEPYQATVGQKYGGQPIAPVGYSADRPVPSLLHTAYAVSALAKVVVLTRGYYRLPEAGIQTLSAARPYICCIPRRKSRLSICLFFWIG